MQITSHDVYETGQRIGWCARPVQRAGPFGEDELHALVTGAGIELVRLHERFVFPRARVDDIPLLRELWRSEDAEWLHRGVFLELDDDEDELELVVHPAPRPLGPAEEHAQLLDAQRRLVASAVRLPAGTEALVGNRLAEVAPGVVERKDLERFARRGRLPSEWMALHESTVTFLCEVISVMRARDGAAASG